MSLLMQMNWVAQDLQQNRRTREGCREEKFVFMKSIYLNKFTLDKTLIIIIIIIWKGHPTCDDLKVLQFGLICLAKKYFIRSLAVVMGLFLYVNLHKLKKVKQHT